MGEEKKKATDALWASLFKAPSVDSYLESNGEELGLPAFSDYIAALCREKGEVPERIIKRAGVERAYGHQVFRGSRNPSRDTVIMLAFGFQADVELAQSLLRHSGHSPLYPRIKRDVAIAYALDRKYSLIDTQQMLSDLGLTIIGGRVK